MTDEDLERLAIAVIKLDGGLYGHPTATKLGRAVLALLERVRKAEANREEWSDRAGEWQQNAKDYARRAEGAEAQLATIAAHIEYAGKESGLPDAVQAFVLASVKTTRAALERADVAEAAFERANAQCAHSFSRAVNAEAMVAELVREGRKVSLNRDDAVDMLGRVRIERDDLNRKLAELERKVLCPNFEHDWGPVSIEGQTVTTCTRCPASIRTIEFRPMQKP